jgi:hypothetical protein
MTIIRSGIGYRRAENQKDTVNLALDEFIQRRKRQEAVELFGKIEFDKNYDYKKSRGKR